MGENSLKSTLIVTHPSCIDSPFDSDQFPRLKLISSVITEIRKYQSFPMNMMFSFITALLKMELFVLTLFQTSPCFYMSKAISPFPTVFSTCLDNFLPFSTNLKVWKSLNFVVWERVK